MQVNIIRHLPTEWNKRGKLQGRRDIPISPVTREMQRHIDKNKKNLYRLGPFRKVLASTLKRTIQTAGHYGYRPEIDPLLDELDFGPFEGMQKSILFETFGERWAQNPKEVKLGESLSALEYRIELFLEKYKKKKHFDLWARFMVESFDFVLSNRRY